MNNLHFSGFNIKNYEQGTKIKSSTGNYYLIQQNREALKESPLPIPYAYEAPVTPIDSEGKITGDETQLTFVFDPEKGFEDTSFDQIV